MSTTQTKLYFSNGLPGFFHFVLFDLSADQRAQAVEVFRLQRHCFAEMVHAAQLILVMKQVITQGTMAFTGIGGELNSLSQMFESTGAISILIIFIMKVTKHVMQAGIMWIAGESGAEVHAG